MFRTFYLFKISIIYFIFFHYSRVIGQNIPLHYWSYNLEKLKIDYGDNWNTHSTINNINLYSDDSLSSNLITNRTGVNSYFGKNIFYGSINNLFNYSYKNKYYSYLFSRLVTDAKKTDGYSGIKQSTKRLGFESGEIGLTGLGYSGEVFAFYFGRGRQMIGAGDGIYLFQSEKSNSFDHFSISHNRRKFKTKYFHGFLENLNGVNRYISGKSIEFLLFQRALASFSEISIYSGKDRPIDIAYLNPLTSHVEIEYNERSNLEGKSSGNAIWQISLDWLINDAYRFSVNYVLDELILDKSQIDSGKTNGLAFSTRLSAIKKYNNFHSNFFISYIYVGTHTFSHEEGSNNFMNRNKPLGWKYGSDGDQISFGFNYYNLKNIISRFEIGSIRIGEQSLYYRKYLPYPNYMKGNFPSGIAKYITYFELKYDWIINNNLRFFINLLNENFNKSPNEFFIGVGFNLHNDNVIN